MWYDLIFSPIGLLIISLVVLATDIIWQFYVAGIIGPIKASNLVLSHPTYKRLNYEIEQFKNKMEIVSDQIDSLRIQMLSMKDNSQLIDIPNLSLEFKELREHLDNTIHGYFGNEAKEYYQDNGLSSEDTSSSFNDGGISKELLKLQDREIQIDYYFNLFLATGMDENQSEILAKSIVNAPKWLKKPVQNRIKAKIKEWGG